MALTAPPHSEIESGQSILIKTMSSAVLSLNAAANIELEHNLEYMPTNKWTITKTVASSETRLFSGDTVSFTSPSSLSLSVNSGGFVRGITGGAQTSSTFTLHAPAALEADRAIASGDVVHLRQPRTGNSLQSTLSGVSTSTYDEGSLDQCFVLVLSASLESGYSKPILAASEFLDVPNGVCAASYWEIKAELDVCKQMCVEIPGCNGDGTPMPTAGSIGFSRNMATGVCRLPYAGAPCKYVKLGRDKNAGDDVFYVGGPSYSIASLRVYGSYLGPKGVFEEKLPITDIRLVAKHGLRIGDLDGQDGRTTVDCPLGNGWEVVYGYGASNGRLSQGKAVGRSESSTK
jgi:hypothetical protein